MRISIYLLLFQILSFAETMSNELTEVKRRQTRNRATVPQSLTLLMNFKNDGTTSFQIMQGSQIVYLDSGFCQYGQLFDPTTGRCRDVFCQELNYKYNGTMCVPDENKNATHAQKRMSDIDLSLSLMISPRSHHLRGNFSKRLNSLMNQTCTNDWSSMFHHALHSYLGIDFERITKVNYTLEHDEEHVAKRSILDPRQNINGKAIHQDYVSDDIVADILENNGSAILNFRFSITDRNEVSNDTSTGLHVVTLLLLATEYNVVLDLCQNYSIQVETLTIISDRNKTRDEFCSDPDVMYPTKNGTLRRRVRPDGETDFVVDIPELETTYEGGDYTYLFIVSTITQPQTLVNQTSEVASTSGSSNPTSSMKLVSVCNRQPRIVGRCPDSVVMRIGLCEVVQYKNFSIRLKRTGRLYTNREYRYDDFRPDLYIVVCKHDVYNETTSKKLGFLEKAPGILSTIATFLSIMALCITLITFMLFSSLRNLPGCNTINLILALILAESLFLSQDLTIVTSSNVCLLYALGIHYFYLASFFWMNVMAYDLWKTFHKGFSLYVYDIHERLPFYALYAWGMPVIIVAIGIILDANDATLKPCYGRYFRGCYDVCFQTKNETPLQGCWIESALMRFLLFGCPIAIILTVNFILYALTVRSIRRSLKKVRAQVERKFQQKKQVIPGEHDVKIYMRMAVLAGFGWTIGFILFLLPDGNAGFKLYLVTIFKYLFILLNATPGLFIFVVYVCNRRVWALYRRLWTPIFTYLHRLKECICHQSRNCFDRMKSKLAKFRRTIDNDSMTTVMKSLELSDQRKYTYYLSERQNRLSSITSSSTNY